MTANRILANEGIIERFGHVSVRDPDTDHVLISRAKSPKLVTEDDIMRMTLDGEVVSNGSARPYRENVIHRAIYRHRDDVNGVVHHHADEIMPFTASGIEFRPVFRRAIMFHAGVPMFDAYDSDFGTLVVSEQEGDRMARTLGDKRALFLKHNGANVTGTSLEAAVISTLEMCQNAAYQCWMELLGDVSYYTPPDDARDSYLSFILSDNSIRRKWEYLVSNLPDDRTV